MESEERIRQWIGPTAGVVVGVLGLLVLSGACLAVLRPFAGCFAWAAILAYATWPIYKRLLRRLHRRSTLAATLMTLFVTLSIIVPVTLVGASFWNDFENGLGEINKVLKEGAPDPPAWVERIPLAGAHIKTYWQNLAHNSDKLMEALKSGFTRFKDWFVARGLDVGQALLQFLLSVFVAFFFYRDGAKIVDGVRSILTRFVGDRGHQIFDVMAGTIKGVVYGIVGTALAQAVLAGIGFVIVGISAPLPLVLAVVTFFLALIPFGPPLIWFPMGVWLCYKGSVGWGVFMLFYGTFVISGVDNVLKPYLISKGSNLPFLLVFFGILGGVVVFGFLGIFVGPTLLAMGYTLIQPWCYHILEDKE